MNMKLDDNTLKNIDTKVDIIATFLNNFKRELISQVNSKIINTLDVFSSTEENRNSICIKIKKTSFKKNSNYVHDSLYYYNIFNPIIYSVINDNIDTILSFYGDKKDIARNILLSSDTSMIYNITTISDNIIYLYF